jgi:hypothetical protein
MQTQVSHENGSVKAFVKAFFLGDGTNTANSPRTTLSMQMLWEQVGPEKAPKVKSTRFAVICEQRSYTVKAIQLLLKIYSSICWQISKQVATK